MGTAVRQFKMLAASVILTLGFTGCGGDNGTGPKPDNPDNPGGGGDPSYTYTGGTVKIGNQTWMEKNLDRATTNSKCYGNSADSCGKYGRLYTWSGALTACPTGWHLPSDAEWTQLTDYAGGELSTAGKKLKSTSGWYDNGNGTDQYGFSALPGGSGYSDGSFIGAGYNGYLWSATGDGASRARGRDMDFSSEGVDRYWYNKTSLYSVRCVQD